MQEFRANKKVQGQARKGRADLWICNDTGDKEELIEAKHKFVSLSGSKDGLPTTIKKSMEEAAKAAEETQGDQHDVTALAVVFASVYAAPKINIDEIDQKIKDFCTGIKSSADYHAFAWLFPKETRELRNKKGYYNPGIAMLVKNIKYG